MDSDFEQLIFKSFFDSQFTAWAYNVEFDLVLVVLRPACGAARTVRWTPLFGLQYAYVFPKCFIKYYIG